MRLIIRSVSISCAHFDHDICMHLRLLPAWSERYIASVLPHWKVQNYHQHIILRNGFDEVRFATIGSWKPWKVMLIGSWCLSELLHCTNNYILWPWVFLYYVVHHYIVLYCTLHCTHQCTLCLLSMGKLCCQRISHVPLLLDLCRLEIIL